MKTYTYHYLKFDLDACQFFTFVDFVQAISFEDAEIKAKKEHEDAVITGQLISTIDENTGKKIDYENYLNN